MLHARQWIVEDIQNILSSDADPDVGTLMAIENEYVRAIEEANGRLRRCDTLLHKGHRAEAIQQCEAEPNLLDVVAALDFPESEEWSEYVKQFLLPAPPPLLIEIAGELNEAYAAEQPVADLMRKHRLHALARSPLRTRIDILRRLAKVDKGNPIWRDDLPTFEKARHTQLRQEVASAAQRGDLQALSGLEQELCSREWGLAPPKQFVTQAAQAHTELRSRHAQAELSEIEEELTTAFSELDFDTARRLRDRWSALVEIAGLQSDDPLLELAAPALEWLARQDQEDRNEADYQAATAALGHAIDENAGRPELERLYFNAGRFDRELPLVLTRRIRERLRSLDEAASRKNKLVLVSIVTAVLAAAGLIGAGINYQLHSQQLAHHVAGFGKLIEDGNLGEAQKFLAEVEKSSPRIFASAEMQQLAGDLRDKIRRDQERQAARAQALAAAEAVLKEPTWESTPGALQETQRAWELSATDDEQADVKKVEGRIRKAQRDLLARVNDAFLAALDELKGRFEHLDEDDLEGIQHLMEDAAVLKRRPRVSPEILAQIDPFEAKLRGTHAAAEQNRIEAGVMLRITDAVGSKDRFRSKLEDYMKRFPGTKRTADFEQVLKHEVELWLRFEQWTEATNRWARRDLSAISPHDAKLLADEATKLLAKHDGFPGTGEVKQLLPYLQVAGQRIDDSGKRIHLALHEPLNNPLVNNLYMLQTKEGEKYYSQQVPKISGDTCQIRFLSDPTLKTGLRSIGAEEIANQRSANGFEWRAPQAVFSRAALDTLAELNDKNWETVFLEILAELFSETQMDPILKLQLLEQVLRVGSQGSLCLAKAFESHMEQIETVQLGAINWIDPADVSALSARIRADGLLRRMKPLAQANEVVKAQLERLKTPAVEARYNWIGWLHRDRNREWTCTARVRPTEKEAGALFVLAAPPDGGAAKFEKIGESAGGRLTLTIAPGTPHIEGRPVYVGTSNRRP